jgi:hypothetical protein
MWVDLRTLCVILHLILTQVGGGSAELVMRILGGSDLQPIKESPSLTTVVEGAAGKATTFSNHQ